MKGDVAFERISRILLVAGLTVAVASCAIAEEPAGEAASRAEEVGKADSVIRARQLAYERQSKIDDARGRALAAMEEGDYRRAAVQWEKLLVLAPADSQALTQAAECRKKMPEQEKKEKLEAERQERGKISLLLGRGRRAYAEHDYSRARAAFEEVLARTPEHPKAKVYLERTTRAEEAAKKLKGRQKEAEDARGKLLEARRQQREARTGIAELLRSGRDHYVFEEYDEAIADWRKVFEKTNPSDRDYQRARAWIQVAEIAKVDRRRQEAWRERARDMEAALHEVEQRWVTKIPVAKKAVAPEGPAEIVSQDRRRLQEKARQPISLRIENWHIRDVLTEVGKIGGVNIVVDETVFPRVEGEAGGGEGVSPNVTLNLKEIPLIEAIDLILRTKGLAYRLEENIIFIATPEKITLGKMETRTYDLPTGAAAVFETLEASIPKVEGGSLTWDKTTGKLIITNTRYNLEIAEDLIRSLSEVPYQVAVEARFVELSTRHDVTYDVDWDLLEAIKGLSDDAQVEIGSTLPQSVFSPSFDFEFERLTPTQFSLAIQALESTGKAHLLSAPSVTTLNNEEATVNVIRTFPYVTTYRVDTEDIEYFGNTLRSSTIVPDSTEERNVGLMLRVRPSVGADKKLINLTLIPEVVEHADWVTYGTIFQVSQPIFFLRHVTTSIVINDGETVVIGGLAKGAETDVEYGIPVISRVPLLGALFKNQVKERSKQNLIVFVTARILGPGGAPLVETAAAAAPTP